jgi:hypothetical protein
MTPEAIVASINLNSTFVLDLENLTSIFGKARITLTAKNGN